MGDVFLGALIILALSVGCYCCGTALVRRCSARLRAPLEALAVSLILGFVFLLHGTLLMARILPLANVVVVGNWIPVGVGFLCGLYVGEGLIPVWRRTIFAAMLTFLGSYSLLSTVGGDSPVAEDWWCAHEVCVQTSPSSCSACCAVMLLRHYGIQSDEAEMVRLCLTDEKGTPTLGLYRGLKIKTKATGWKVEPFRASVEELRQDFSDPVVLLVRCEPDQRLIASFLQQAGGWVRSARTDHAVVLYEFKQNGRIVVGDPSCGRCEWTIDELKGHWRGDGLRLVSRQAR